MRISLNGTLIKKRWIITGLTIFILLISIIWFLDFKSSTIKEFKKVQAAQSNNTIFYDIDKKPFHIISGIEDRKYVKLNNISRKLQISVVAIEDGRFFQHFGFDPIRIIAATLRLFKKNASLQGASTITQQLVKLTLLSPDISIKRKVTEIFMAIALEIKYSKSQLFEFYLNKVYLGHGNYGVENAALNFFHKQASDLTLAESAFIAGLIKKPEGYSPFVNLKMSRRRQLIVLKRLKTLKWISSQQYNDAINEQLLIRKRRPSSYQIAPYFTNHILLQLKQKYGHKMIYGGGLQIYTTLDRKIQMTMEEVKTKRLNQERSFEEIAGVSIDPLTGFVRALIGGADFFKSEFNRVTQAKRQPGSSFKPILYATALSKGLKPTTTFWDEPTQYTREVDNETEVYEPGNYSREHLGQITMSYALRVSNNVVSVQILNKIGISTLIKSAKRFGINLPKKQGLCLALGCGETTLLNLVNAYGAFANQGLLNQPVFVLKITDSQNRVMEEYTPEQEIQVISPEHAFQINQILQDVVNFGTGRNAKIDRESAGKTGTSDNNRDAWYIGYTPTLVTGFWVGNDDNTPMDNEVGGKTPAKLWRSFMNRIPESGKVQSFRINEAFEDFLICNHTGKLATQYCPSKSWYALLKDDPPKEYCDVHTQQQVEVQICQTSGKLATQYCPIENIKSETFSVGSEPEIFCDIHFSQDESFDLSADHHDYLPSSEATFDD